MTRLTDFPLLVFAIALVWLYLWAQIGAALGRRRPIDAVGAREDFDVISAATLTLLGLIIAFSFSMAISRYDQRKNYEETEANAIGTEYVRAGLLPAADGTAVRTYPRQHQGTHPAPPVTAGGVDFALFIADLDSPRGGVIHVSPQNLVSLIQAGVQGSPARIRREKSGALSAAWATALMWPRRLSSANGRF
jgi:hypothetical protein